MPSCTSLRKILNSCLLPVKYEIGNDDSRIFSSLLADTSSCNPVLPVFLFWSNI